MERDDFAIGMTFWTGSGAWRCTDIGTRTIVAISLDVPDPSWLNGPPYAVAETVFDEFDIMGCYTEAERFDEVR